MRSRTSRGVPEVKIYIWEVLFWPPENVRDFSILYREGSRRFQSGAHLHGGTHMNVGSGGKDPHPWLRRTKIPPLEGIRSYPEGIRSRSLKRGDNNLWGRERMRFLSSHLCQRPNGLGGQ